MRVRVCFGSLAEVPARRRRVRFTPDSGHPLAPEKCRLWANSGHGTGVDRFLTRGVQRIVLRVNRSSHGVLQAVIDDR